MKLQVKLTLLVISGVIITILLLIALLFLFSDIFLHGYTHVDLQNISQEVEKRLQPLAELSPAAVGDALRSVTAHYPGVEIELFAQDGTPLYASTGQTKHYAFEEWAKKFVDQPYNLFSSQDVHLLYEIRAGSEPLYLMLSVAGESLLNVQVYLYFNEYSSVPFLIIPTVLIILLPALFVTGYAVRVNRRIKALNAAMSQTDLNQPSVQVADRSKDEIGRLAQLFNKMSDHLHRQFTHIQQIEKARKSLISGLSHNLRTPLTSIKGYAETLQRSKTIGSRELHRYSTIIVQRAEYMEHLLNQLFEIAMPDEMPVSLQKNGCNLSKAAQQIIMDYAYILEDKGIEPDIRVPSTAIWVNMDEREVNQVVCNLIENAIHHGKDGRYLGVYLEDGEDFVRLSIRDKGKGIPAEYRDQVFERFNRLRIGKEKTSEGLGVGLSIAKEIVERHNGRIILESEPFVLTVFTVELPKRVSSSHKKTEESA